MAAAQLRSAVTGMVGAAVLCVGAAWYFTSRVVRVQGERQHCFENQHFLAAGLLMYAQDYDERMPAAGEWMDVTLPYVRSAAHYHCPAAPGSYGYAFNSRLSRVVASVIDDPYRARPWPNLPKPDPAAAHPAATLLLFDSATLARNAADPGTTLPSPGRHPSAGRGGNNVTYLDGRSAWLPSAPAQ